MYTILLKLNSLPAKPIMLGVLLSWFQCVIKYKDLWWWLLLLQSSFKAFWDHEIIFLQEQPPQWGGVLSGYWADRVHRCETQPHICSPLTSFPVRNQPILDSSVLFYLYTLIWALTIRQVLNTAVNETGEDATSVLPASPETSASLGGFQLAVSIFFDEGRSPRQWRVTDHRTQQPFLKQWLMGVRV